MTDLFENLPSELVDLFDNIEGELDYDQLKTLQNQCEQRGFTFDYYLDATPYNLRSL